MTSDGVWHDRDPLSWASLVLLHLEHAFRSHPLVIGIRLPSPGGACPAPRLQSTRSRCVAFELTRACPAGPPERDPVTPSQPSITSAIQPRHCLPSSGWHPATLVPLRYPSQGSVYPGAAVRGQLGEAPVWTRSVSAPAPRMFRRALPAIGARLSSPWIGARASTARGWQCASSLTPCVSRSPERTVR